MFTVRLLQKALNCFRKLEAKPHGLSHTEEPVVQIDTHRSKRARIKDVLRRYEQGDITEAEAVEELLKMMR